MKKIFLLSIVFIIVSGMFSAEKVYADSEADTQIVKEAITKYKNKNYIGCISDLRLYTEKDNSNAVAWYYLGNAYMNIGLKDEAHASFEKVISLNTIPKLTSYSIQAEVCMENSEKCEYRNFTNDEIKKLKENPNVFLEQYFANINSSTKDPATVEIENLINGSYKNNIHPNALKFIEQERTKMKKDEYNSGNAYIPADDKLSQALSLLKDNDNQVSSFAMMMDTPKNPKNNDYEEILKKYNELNNNKTITPEMVQLMMMQNMIPNF